VGCLAPRRQRYREHPCPQARRRHLNHGHYDWAGRATGGADVGPGQPTPKQMPENLLEAPSARARSTAPESRPPQPTRRFFSRARRGTKSLCALGLVRRGHASIQYSRYWAAGGSGTIRQTHHPSITSASSCYGTHQSTMLRPHAPSCNAPNGIAFHPQCTHAMAMRSAAVKAVTQW
jgi:hypothetical protein